MSIEKRVRKRARFTDFQRALLMLTAGTGLVTTAALAPNAIQYLPKDLLSKFDPSDERTFKRSRKALVRRGYLEFSHKEGVYVLTTEGKRYLELAQGDVKRKWDKKWRVLIFDISEKRRSGRSAVRYKLAQFGLIRLQDSVWVYPYPCDEFIALLKTELKLGKNLLYLIADEFEGEEDLLDHFKLHR